MDEQSENFNKKKYKYHIKSHRAEETVIELKKCTGGVQQQTG